MCVLSGESVEIADEMIGAQGQIGRFWTHWLPHVRDNEVCGYFFIATEVTELWQSQQRQHELNAALQQADQRS